MSLFYYISNHILFVPFVFMFLASIVITVKSRFIQFRTLPRMLKILTKKSDQDTGSTQQAISPRSALLVSLSTAIGMGNIAGPIIAVGLGGPGALAGFIVAMLFGSAAAFVEVYLAIKYRTKLADGSYAGGTMPYLNAELGSAWGSIYAYSCSILMLSWSATQANQLAALLRTNGLPSPITGILLGVGIIVVLIGGIKRLGALCDKLVPVMFVTYCACTLWIIALNFQNIPMAFSVMFSALFSPVGLTGVSMGYGMQKAFRWGLARAVQAYETGVGTLTFPHSTAKQTNPYDQGVLAIATTYGNGLICLLTGLTIMVTGAWMRPGAAFDITMFSQILADYFPALGSHILTFCALLFAFGTIVGNSYNGSQCFIYFATNKWLWIYHLVSAIAVFIGCILHVTFIFTMIDYFILPVAIPHTIAIVILAFKKGKVWYEPDNKREVYEHSEH